MTRRQTSFLIAALLRFVGSKNHALAGDLAEELRAGRSRRWFWGQLTRAILVMVWQRQATALATRGMSALAVAGLVAAVAMVGLTSVALVRDGYFEGVILSSVAGGALIARLIFRHSATRSNLPVTLDPFARNGIARDPLNYAHIRVAGIGGAGLVVAAAVMALQYQLTTAALVLGLLGGLVGAVVVIIVRRLRVSKRPGRQLA